MNPMVIVIICLLYLIIGGIIAGLVNDEDMEWGILLAWPIFLLFCIAIGTGYLCKKLGGLIANCIKRYFVKSGEEK